MLWAVHQSLFWRWSNPDPVPWGERGAPSMERGTEPPLHVALCSLDLSPDFLEPRAPVCSGCAIQCPCIRALGCSDRQESLVECGSEFCLVLCKCQRSVYCSGRNSENSADAEFGSIVVQCKFQSFVHTVNRYAKTVTLPLPNSLLRRQGEWRKLSNIKIVSHKDKMKKINKIHFLIFRLGDRLWEWILSLVTDSL